jgi:Outer membrane protein beta-barrel domain
MRRILVVIILCLPCFAIAQTRVGVRAGLNFTSIDFNDWKPPKRFLTRMNIGTMIEIPLDENWLLLTGPYYSGKGVIYGRSPSTNKIDSTTIRLNYIELPVIIGYNFSGENEKRLTIAGGTYISYGFNGRITTRNSSNPPITHLHKKGTEKYKRLELGFNFSSMYEINDRYGLRLDFSKSLLNITRFDKQKNMVVGFSFFWYLKNKRGETE